MIRAAAPAVAVAAKVADAPPAMLAVTPGEQAPAWAPSVHRVCARPAASVGPLAGVVKPQPGAAVHVTVVPLTTLPNWSVTRTTSGCGSGVPTGAVCASPETTATREATSTVPVAVSAIVLAPLAVA